MGRDKNRSDFLSGKTTKGALSPTGSAAGQNRFSSKRDMNLIGRRPPEKEKTHPFVKIATLLALGLAVFAFLIPDSSSNRNQNSKKPLDTSSSKSSSQNQVPDKQRGAVGTKKILFIGNDLTGNVIPAEVCKMLNTGKVETYKCHALIKGGFHLTHHLDKLPKHILSNNWDLVILQEHSSMVSKNADHPWTAIHHNSLRNIASRLSKNDPLFAYMPPWPESFLTAKANSASSIKQKLDRHSTSAAHAIYNNSSMQVTILPVAQSLVKALQLYSKDELFSGKNYLSDKGSCLAAWTIAILLVGEENTNKSCSLIHQAEPSLFNIAKIAASEIPSPVLR